MDWKQLGKRLIFLPLWAVLLLTVVSGVLLALVFIRGLEESPVAYVTYALSFYALCVLAVSCVFTLPPRYRAIKQKIYANPLGNRYLTQPQFRARISLFLSLIINVVYIGLNLLSWHLMGSLWFMVLALYYLTLSLLRFLLLGHARRDDMGDTSRRAWRRCKACGCILLLLNLSLSGAVLMILYQNKGFSYPGILIYVMAAYTFYITTHAIVELVKHRRFHSPVISTAKLISLCAALVSMLNLETAMFSQFGGDMAPQNQRLMIILTGAGVSIIVIALSGLLIVRATREMKQ